MIRKEKHDAFERVTLATAIVGVIILCIYTGLTGYQAYIAKDAAQRQLRAYISVVVEKQPDLNGQGPSNVVLLFKNNGQTPAYSVEARSLTSVVAGSDLALTEAQLKEIHSALDRMNKYKSVVFPGQEFRQGPEPGTGIPMTDEQKIAVSMGAMTLWINGEVTYTDAFELPRFTRFRLFMSGAAGSRFDKLIWADAGNEAN
jgi:hypothetical protein